VTDPWHVLALLALPWALSLYAAWVWGRVSGITRARDMWRRLAREEMR
jgi:hypothetical protein